MEGKSHGIGCPQYAGSPRLCRGYCGLCLFKFPAEPGAAYPSCWTALSRFLDNLCGDCERCGSLDALIIDEAEFDELLRDDLPLGFIAASMWFGHASAADSKELE